MLGQEHAVNMEYFSENPQRVRKNKVYFMKSTFDSFKWQSASFQSCTFHSENMQMSFYSNNYLTKNLITVSWQIVFISCYTANGHIIVNILMCPIFHFNCSNEVFILFIYLLWGGKLFCPYPLSAFVIVWDNLCSSFFFNLSRSSNHCNAYNILNVCCHGCITSSNDPTAPPSVLLPRVAACSDLLCKIYKSAVGLFRL